MVVIMRDRDGRQLGLRLRHAVLNRLARLGQRFEATRRRLERQNVSSRIAGLRTRTVAADARLRQVVMQRRLAADSHARQLSGRLDALSPLAVLARGYAVCWNAERTTIIRSSEAVDTGDRVRVTLADGELTCRVEGGAASDHP